MSKKQSKPTGTFTAGALLATGTTPDSPAVITGISESSGFLTPANGLTLGTATARAGAGAVPVTASICELTTSGTAQALTLADGVEGQLLTITYKAEGAAADSATLTVANGQGFASIPFNTLGDTATLVFTSGKWALVSYTSLFRSIQTDTPAARSGPGAVSISSNTTHFTSTATGNALTLADGFFEGQTVTILYIAEAAGADTGVLTPANRGGYSTITFNAVGDSATLVFTNARWYIVGTRGVTVA
jgi:hypothetical protein